MENLLEMITLLAEVAVKLQIAQILQILEENVQEEGIARCVPYTLCIRKIVVMVISSFKEKEEDFVVKHGQWRWAVNMMYEIYSITYWYFKVPEESRGVKCNFTKQPVDQHRLINLYNLQVF